MSPLQRLRTALLDSWPHKLGAVVLAVVVWLFVNASDPNITQSTVTIPIAVEGIPEGSVAVGLPQVVTVTVSGPSTRIDRLRPENLEAVLDLEGRTGSFEQAVRVVSPPSIEVVQVVPNEVIGTVEQVTEKVVPVDPALIGSQPQDARVRVSVEPTEVVVRGRASTLAEVARATLPVRSAPGERNGAPFAADASGRPIPGVTLEPASLRVVVTEEPVLVTKELVIDLEPPSVPPYTVTARPDQAQVTVIGPPSQLEDLDRVVATVGFETEEPQPGGYTLPVTLELPEGVRAMAQPTATVRLARPPVAP